MFFIVFPAELTVQHFPILQFRMAFKKPGDAKKNSAISSAALQDHMMRKFDFKLDFGVTPLHVPVRKKLPEKLPSIVRMDADIKKLESAQKISILPYQQQGLRRLKEQRSDEEKMARYKKGLTLAQKLGLVEAPELPLTAKDWQAIEERSKTRNDSEGCCSICLQDFKLQPQAILSCSHVFHMKCLNSYEKHNRAKCCPICRRRDYQKKVIDQAIRDFTLKSILRIQRTFRGSQCRIALYKSLVSRGYTCKSQRFNRRLIGYKMWLLSKKIETTSRKNQEYLGKMLQIAEKQHQKSQQDLLQEMVEIQRGRFQDQRKVEEYLDRLGLREKKSEVIVNWEEVKEKGIARKDEQCSICLMNLWSKPTYLLSCTHLFHMACIQSFERYALPGNGNKCPCCRSHYSKKLIQKL